ncbi:helix-turn-helix domain-containing protein [Fluviispira multicolorata]|uniref:Helix-turn-helix domain-containing protein n=1 Tax=Fluviispira multicolorata TaxID=2654512 RepID=A0A833JFL5_9BACT|nr:helix-turn-helix transcriptional regulator [Fluviispira multicolorata]KAB8031019.1 helix-turn-helix domain-containing protein [Fluviispira multicolorata]
MNTANRKKSAFEILGLSENNISLRKIQDAYENLKKQLDNSVTNDFTRDELEHAFQELVNITEKHHSNDSEEEVISAHLLPNMKNRKKEKIDDTNIIYIRKDIPKNIPKKSREIEVINRPIDSLMDMKVSMKKARAIFSENPDHLKRIDEIIEETEEITGNLLKRLREELRVSLDEIANRIKVSKVYLEAIENDSYSSLPAEVYVKGFFNSYLNYLGLDRKDIVEALTEVYRTRRRLTKRK